MLTHDPCAAYYPSRERHDEETRHVSMHAYDPDDPDDPDTSDALRDVIVALAAAKPQKLTTTLQVRLPPDTAEALDALVARINAASEDRITRSDLVRAAVTVLVAQ